MVYVGIEISTLSELSMHDSYDDALMIYEYEVIQDYFAHIKKTNHLSIINRISRTNMPERIEIILCLQLCSPVLGILTVTY